MEEVKTKIQNNCAVCFFLMYEQTTLNVIL